MSGIANPMDGIVVLQMIYSSHEIAPYYHTVYDSYDNLNPECIELTRKIIKTAVDMFDGVGHIF